MSDLPVDPDGDGPQTNGPKPSIADVASWLRRAAEEPDRTADPSEAATGGAGATDASTPSTRAADEPGADRPADRPPVPSDHGDGAPVEPPRATADDQEVNEAARGPEAPAVLRPTGSAGRPARDLWGRLLPVGVVAAGTDDRPGPPAELSTSTGRDQAQAATQEDNAGASGQEELGATGPRDASGAGADHVPAGPTATSDGTAADGIWGRAEPATDDIGAAGRSPTADQPGSGVGGWAGGTRACHVSSGPAGTSDLPLADPPPGDGPGGTPSSQRPLGDAEVGGDSISEARGGEAEGMGLVPEDPVRDDRGGDDEPVDRGGPEGVGPQHTVGAGDLSEATPDDRGQDRREAGDQVDDERPAPDLVPSERATADTTGDAVQPVEVVAPADDQEQFRQVPGGGDEPATHLVPSGWGPGPGVPRSPDPVDGTGSATDASVGSRDDGAPDDQAQDEGIGAARGGQPAPPDQPAADAIGAVAPEGRLGDQAGVEVEPAPTVEAAPSGSVDRDQEGGPPAGTTALGDGREAGQTPEPLPSTDVGTASAPADRAPPAAPRLAGIWTRWAPSTAADVEDEGADRDGRGDKATTQDGRSQATDQDGRGERVAMAPAGLAEVDERPSAASDDGDDPAGSEATASVATLDAAEDGPVDPEWSAGADGGIVTGDVEMDDDDAAAAEPTPQSPVAAAVAELRRRHAVKRKRYPRGQLKERIGILQRVRAMLGVVLLTVLLGVAAGAAIGAFLFFVAFAIRSAITSS